MTNDEFNDLIEDLIKTASNTLHKKNSAYAFDSSDPLENFNVGSDIAGMTPPQTCWGYLTKHLAALKGMIDRNDFSDLEDFKEKCQDSINYILLLWCLGNEQRVTQKDEKRSDHPVNHTRLCRAKDSYEYFTISMKHQTDAERVLNDLHKIIAEYNTVSVADMYSLVDLVCDYRDDVHGWTNIDDAAVVKDPHGYSIKMPEPVRLYR